MIKNGWFYELKGVWYDQAMAYEVEEVLCEHKSKYQDILIFKSKVCGNVLVLDGCVQCTDKDEFMYQEMITFLPLNSHPSPKKVLVIGAGDGGVIREVAKHPLVETIVQCEIDEDVINLSKKYLPNLACGYDSPKHKLHVGCGKEFMKQCCGEFDVIITDSSDSVGPAAALFEKEYYELIRTALKPDGVLCSEGHCPWLDSQFVKTMFAFCKPLFPVVQYGYTNVPTYPGGQIGFLLCSRSSETRFDQPVTKFTQDQVSSLNLRLYNHDVHTAAFAIPQFFEKNTEDFYDTGPKKPENWFWEDPQSIGQSLGLAKRGILFQEKINNIGNVVVFENYIYGNVLVINGVVQCTERDQVFYQECLTHLPLNSHPNPKKVLIIGGFGGGAIQEVSRHQSVETIIQCESNKEILEISKRFFPDASAGYSCPKLQTLHIGGYTDYLKEHPEEFDVIVTVPPKVFLKPEMSEPLKNALKTDGIAISRVPSYWVALDDIQKLVKHDKKLFPNVTMACSYQPTNPYGQTSFILRSLNPDTCFTNPVKQLSDGQLSQLKFYSPDVHQASFALPEFVRKVVES